ncbi:MAG: hypothetical protein JO323_11690 [Acidobacteriia bacterium]|nr:hypothetical protein [Terriglobia bacterium]
MDLRVPSGAFFLLLGILVALVGLVSPDTRAPLTAVNINLYAGIAMLLFGTILLLLARRARQ